jgi:lipopolysaccharide export system permease protein
VDLSTRTFYQIIYHTDSLPVESQFFRKDPDTGNVFYVTQVAPDNRTMEGVEIFKPGHGGPWVETLQAKTANVDGTQLDLHDVVDTRYNAEGFMSSQQHVDTIAIGLPLAETAAQFMSSLNSDPCTMSSKALSTQVKAMQAQGLGGSALGSLQINLANRLAWPFACVIGVVIALPLAIRFGSRGRTLGITLAVVAFFIYFILMSIASAFGRNGQIDPVLAAWVPNVIMGVTGIVLLWREDR